MLEGNTISLQYENKDGSLGTEQYRLGEFLFSVSPKGVALVTMNTPDSLNSMENNQLAEMRAVLDHCSRSDDVKVVVLTGAGRAFCSGANQKDFNRAVQVPARTMQLLDKRYVENELGAGNSMSKQWRAESLGNGQLRQWISNFLHFKKPIIGAVNGLGVGGGANLAIFLMDLCYCSKDAWFSWPFTQLGIQPELTSTMRFPAQAGAMVAKKYMMLGTRMTANEALGYHLVTEVHPKETFLKEALAAAEKLAGFNDRAVQLTKALINRGTHTSEETNQTLDREFFFVTSRKGLAIEEMQHAMESDLASHSWPKGASKSKL